ISGAPRTARIAIADAPAAAPACTTAVTRLRLSAIAATTATAAPPTEAREYERYAASVATGASPSTTARRMRTRSWALQARPCPRKETKSEARADHRPEHDAVLLPHHDVVCPAG